MRRFVMILLAIMASQQAVAQQTFAVGASINDQSDRVSASYRHYLEKCINLDEEGGLRQRLMIPSPGCTEARTNFKLQVDVLVRLIHGDPPTIICSKDGCPTPSN